MVEINKLVNFVLKNGTNKDGKNWYAICLKIGQVERVLTFLTHDQYLLVQNSLK